MYLRSMRVFLMLGLLLMAAMHPGSGKAQGLQPFEFDTLTIVTQDNEQHDFTVELAQSPEQRALGLMYRQDLAEDHGMLFIYSRPNEASMWMKNTYISLDMLFIDARGRIVRIAERTEPHSLRAISSGRPVRAVLELKGGTAERLGLTTDAQVKHSAFDSGS